MEETTKNILVVIGGGRSKGNTKQLVDAFSKGTVEAGHHVEVISLNGLAIVWSIHQAGDCKSSVKCTQERRWWTGAPDACAPSGRMFQRVKVPNPPDSGKDIEGAMVSWVTGNLKEAGGKSPARRIEIMKAEYVGKAARQVEAQ